MVGKKILILNSYGYFGGTLVLSCLCRILCNMGYDAKLFVCEDFPQRHVVSRMFIKRSLILLYKYRLRRCIYKLFKRFSFFRSNQNNDVSPLDMDGLSFKMNPFIDKENTIVIYPETTYGNPLGGKNVVRWLLSNRYPLLQEGRGVDDLYVCYRQFFNDEILNPKKCELHIRYFDNKLYNQYNFEERSGNCYILRKKGRMRKDLPESFDGIVFDDNMTQRELVEVFNKCKYCYSYDTQTFYTVIAAVCGCIPIVVLEPGKSEVDYREETRRNHYGIAYGDTPEQIDYAIKTREKLLKSLDFDEENKVNVLNFVKLLEQKFGPVKRI